MKFILIIFLIVGISDPSWADVFSCKSKSGKTIFTDSVKDCPDTLEYEIKENMSSYSTDSPVGLVFPIEFGHQHCVGKTAYFKGEYEIKIDRIEFRFTEIEIKKTRCGRGPVKMTHIRAELWSKKLKQGKEFSDEAIKGTIVKVKALLEKGESTTLDDVKMTIYTNDLKSKDLNDYNLVMQLEGVVDGRQGWNYERYQGNLIPN